MPRSVVVLRIGSHFLGVDIALTKSVIAPVPITPMPRSPDFLKGVFNFRGAIVPVLDLAARLKLEADCPNRICVVDCGSGPAGLLVDDVLEVAEVGEGEETTPWLSSSPFVSDVSRLTLSHYREQPEEALVLLLDVPILLELGIAA